LIFREVEDADLVARARRGDVDAYNVLISRWDRRVFHYLLKLVGDREDAMDLAQEVFLKAWQALSKLEDAGRFSPWLFRIAHNEAYSLLRRARPREEVTEQAGGDLSTGRMYPAEITLAVRRALEGLSPEQREAVVLKVYQGFKFEEMAEILETPVSTVKSRLYTGLELLKQALAPVGG
jgi:RNA polymerase sigma-70 factor (ECF subfamily)